MVLKYIIASRNLGLLEVKTLAIKYVIFVSSDEVTNTGRPT